MAKKVKELQPPTGPARLLWRAPIWLYRLGFGWMLGKRFVLINHIGRVSGKKRQAVLEVVRYDKETKEVIITAGFGEKTQWYQNVLKNPEISIQLGAKKIDVIAERLSPQQSGEEILGFSKRYPGEAKFIQLLGYEVDGSDEDYRAAGEMMIMLALRPR
ncbi:nitroreductase family deazaflavin-dependent oxidoreductase [Chloroflexota bacterium]